MSYNDLRKGRWSGANQIYLITAVTDHRAVVFIDFAAARIAVNALRAQDAHGLTSTLAWVVMPDHIHWLLSLRVDSTLGEVVKYFKGRSAREINAHLGCGGSLWQPAYHDRALRRDEDVKAIARYIVMNPVRAGLVEKIGDYPHWDAAWL